MCATSLHKRLYPCLAADKRDAMYSMMPHYAHLPPNFVVPVALEKNLCPTGMTALVRSVLSQRLS